MITFAKSQFNFIILRKCYPIGQSFVCLIVFLTCSNHSGIILYYYHHFVTTQPTVHTILLPVALTTCNNSGITAALDCWRKLEQKFIYYYTHKIYLKCRM